MPFVLQPWQLLFTILAGWINEEQQHVIDYLRTENEVLKEKLGKKRIVLTDEQRCRLAVKGKVLGRKLLERSARLSHRTRSCGGIGSSSLRNGTIATGAEPLGDRRRRAKLPS